MRKRTPCPELTLPAPERRKRYRRMAQITAGANAVTKRQIRRLPSRDTPSAKRKGSKMLRRILKRQGLTMADIA